MDVDYPEPERTDVLRPYDVTDDGELRVERVTRETGETFSHQRVRSGTTDLAVLACFDGDVPSIDLTTADARTVAWAEELTGA